MEDKYNKNNEIEKKKKKKINFKKIKRNINKKNII